ncbi:hypothetical protein [Agarilytica rhodophyticola]|uniref:hypothetical protein n=1 Tax=Agarilytica rhodophyticola TaxID=1737490 RepID=UPI000B34A09D|nr:hypothetical protein [Agarilytica rhodophyticola]
MNQNEFAILTTNTMGISDQLLAKQCGSFLDELVDSDDPALAEQLSGLEGAAQNPDYQTMIDQGYAALESLSEDVVKAWQKVDQEKLQDLIGEIPSQMPDLTKKISGDDVEKWVSYLVGMPEGNSFSDLHQYCYGLFNNGTEGKDAIRLAIADDDVAILEDAKDAITSEDITFEDINTALMIESVKSFEWLAKKMNFTDEQVQLMLEYVSSDSQYFETVYKILAPTSAQYSAILASVTEMDEQETLAFLQQQGS